MEQLLEIKNYTRTFMPHTNSPRTFMPHTNYLLITLIIYTDYTNYYTSYYTNYLYWYHLLLH